MIQEVLNYWHWLTHNHSHLERDDEEIVICYPRWWWFGKTHYLYKHEGSDFFEVTQDWLKRLARQKREDDQEA